MLCTAPQLQCRFSIATSPSIPAAIGKDSFRDILCVPFLYAHFRPSFLFALLGRSPDLRIQPHEMVVDGILLPRLRSLFHPAQQRLVLLLPS